MLLQIQADARIEVVTSVPENIQLSADLSPDSLEHRGPHSSLHSPRGCRGSPATAARGSVSAEADASTSVVELLAMLLVSASW